MSVVVIGMKIARSRDLVICVCCKHNELVDICEKTSFCMLQIAEHGSQMLQMVHLWFSMPVVYLLHIPTLLHVLSAHAHNYNSCK